MFDWYERVRIKSNGYPGTIVDINDKNGKCRRTYLVEVDDEYKVGYMPEDVISCEQEDIELLNKM
ncbi:MAG: hypothetical protein NC126_11085 [Clostridium sp.]|nr:hypothetical protein [Clostridium sp.]